MSFYVAPRYYSRCQPAFGGFSGLQRLMQDFDRQIQQAAEEQRQPSRHVPKFTPKFDMRETETTYELQGDLAGIEKENVHIEFSDPQTLVVRGHVDHSYTAGTPPAGLISNEKPEEASAASAEADEEPVVINSDAEETSSNKSYQATVEDEAEEGASTVAQPTPATTVAESAKPAEQPKPEAPKQKYWVSERSYGQFSRSFAFPTRVETEGVSASLNSGVLSVSVPKAKKHESRRINVN